MHSSTNESYKTLGLGFGLVRERVDVDVVRGGGGWSNLDRVKSIIVAFTVGGRICDEEGGGEGD